MTNALDLSAAREEAFGGTRPGLAALDIEFALLVVSHILGRVQSAHAGPQVRGARGGLAPYQLRRVVEHIERNLADDVSVTELTALAGLSASHFCHAFKRSTGLTPRGWLRARRVARARELLASTLLPLSEIALACGFADQAHFGRTFRDLEGRPPGAWRRAHRT